MKITDLGIKDIESTQFEIVVKNLSKEEILDILQKIRNDELSFDRKKLKIFTSEFEFIELNIRLHPSLEYDWISVDKINSKDNSIFNTSLISLIFDYKKLLSLV